MNAKEAREKAISLNLRANNSQLEAVNKAIQSAVEEGKFTAYYHEGLNDVVVAELRRRDFKVSEYSDHRDGITITISW
jgi:hypothetical protein